ncbi:hypothetical protein [Lentilitoribacter sp. Alg239-R112]|uniref:hypothetical protein n=1 Tax=Lentilitoribacter sp. Alg239-R112 TaxID=2305987 RepID=UPI0013A6FC34|nr:hypothetical protein [Lentilitoribacter sp. Alg239-R112]
MLFMAKSAHRRDYLVKRVAECLSPAESANVAGEKQRQELDQSNASRAFRALVLAALVIIVLALPLSIWLTLV